MGGMGMGIRLSMNSGFSGEPGTIGSSYGPELVTNGTFDTDVTGWSTTSGGSWVAGKLRVTSPGSTNGSKQTILTLESGATYNFRATQTPHEGDRARIQLGVATTQTLYYAVVGGTIDITFVAASTGIDITAEAANSAAWASAAEYAEFDNISLRKVL
jgi:hypothetical protein